MEISNVSPGDIAQITDLQNQLLLDKSGYNEGQGFLVSGYTEEDYRRFARINEYFFKAVVDGKLAGVLMAYESKNIDPEDKNNSLLKYILRKDFVLIKQIFVGQDYANRGVATALYKHLFARIPDDRPTVAVIVMEPFNKVSCEFHRRRGFAEFLNFVPEPDHDNVIRKRSAWIRPSRKDENYHEDIRLANVHDGADDIGNTMSSRHTNLVTLYRHEDNLNWTKIGMQCTILFALIAVVAYFYDKNIPTESWPFLAMLGVCGIIVNIMFLKKIMSGLNYMNTYKDKIKEYDEILSFHYPKVPVLFDKRDFISNRSVTCRLILFLSYMGLAMWILTASFLIYKAIDLNTPL